MKAINSSKKTDDAEEEILILRELKFFSPNGGISNL